MNFDSVAPWYRTLETIAFGNTLQRARVACLGEIAPPKRVLIVGEGNGRFLTEFLRRHPRAQVDCLDSSERMLQLARQRVENAAGRRLENVRWLHQDIAAWDPPEQQYDLLVTHFVLDCFEEQELAIVVRKLAQAAARNAEWLLAEFRVPAAGISRVHAQLWLAVMYRFFRLTAGIDADRLSNPTPYLQAEGFTLARRHLFRGEILKSEIWRRRNSDS